MGTDMRFKGSTINEPYSRGLAERLAVGYMVQLFSLATTDTVVSCCAVLCWRFLCSLVGARWAKRCGLHTHLLCCVLRRRVLTNSLRQRSPSRVCKPARPTTSLRCCLPLLTASACAL